MTRRPNLEYDPGPGQPRPGRPIWWRVFVAALILLAAYLLFRTVL